MQLAVAQKEPVIRAALIGASSLIGADQMCSKRGGRRVYASALVIGATQRRFHPWPRAWCAQRPAAGKLFAVCRPGLHRPCDGWRRGL